jgi:hypothetical protein
MTSRGGSIPLHFRQTTYSEAVDVEGTKNDRRSLSQQRGRVETGGDSTLAALAQRALRVPKDADPRVGTQGFHAWPGRMHPHTARTLVNHLPSDAFVADPFMGGGTVVVESLLSGRGSYGADLNPVALEVAWARTRAWTKPQLGKFMEEAARCVRGCRDYRKEHKRVPPNFFQTEGEWYDPPALMEVWGLTEQICRQPDRAMLRMLRVCLSSILVKVSRQASDSVTRKDRDHQWVPRGRVEDLFLRRAQEQSDNLSTLSRRLPNQAVEPLLVQADATQPLDVQPGSVTAIVSSPPYPGTYDYVEHHRRRYLALGLEPHLAERAEMGSRRRQKKAGNKATMEFTASLARALTSWQKALSANSHVFLVLGDGQSPNGVIPTRPIVLEAAEKARLEVSAWASQPRLVRGAVGRGIKGGKHEHIFVLSR